MGNRVPALNSGVRQKFDAVRKRDVLLGPERALMLDDIGKTILAELDGQCSVDEISATLAGRFNAPVDVIKTDVNEFLANLANIRFVIFRQTKLNDNNSPGENR